MLSWFTLVDVFQYLSSWACTLVMGETRCMSRSGRERKILTFGFLMFLQWHPVPWLHPRQTQSILVHVPDSPFSSDFLPGLSFLQCSNFPFQTISGVHSGWFLFSDYCLHLELLPNTPPRPSSLSFKASELSGTLEHFRVQHIHNLTNLPSKPLPSSAGSFFNSSLSCLYSQKLELWGSWGEGWSCLPQSLVSWPFIPQ